MKKEILKISQIAIRGLQLEVNGSYAAYLDIVRNISKKLSQHADTVLNVANKLEISDDVKELLKRNLRSEAENISQLSEKSLKFGTVVADASDKYQSTENGLTEG